jgi:hemin uptake protein HemP
MDKTVHRNSEVTDPVARGARAPGEVVVVETPRVRCVESTWLFQGGREVVIVHHGQEYRLRITKSDKLILTK